MRSSLKPHLVLLVLLLAACEERVAPTVRAAPVLMSIPPEPFPTGAPLGTAHPVWKFHAPPDGQWLVLLQEREDFTGDGEPDVAPYLLLEPGPGERIGAFCASDPSGRYLVILRGDASWLIDSYTRVETRLGPRLDNEEASRIGRGFFYTACAEFSADGRRVLFLRSRGAQERPMAVVREVEGGAEFIVDPGQGLLDSVMMDATGQWLLVSLITRDTSGDGVLRRINGFAELGMGRQPYGDAAEDRVLRVVGREPRDPDAFLAPMGRFALYRGARGEVLAEDMAGHRTEWVPAECGARILQVDVLRETLLVFCPKRGDPVPLELHGQQVHESLGPLRVKGLAYDGFWKGSRLVTLRAQDFSDLTNDLSLYADRVFDLDRHTVHPTNGLVVFTHEAQVLVRDSAYRLWLMDVERGERTLLVTPMTSRADDDWDIRGARGLVLAQGWLADLAAGRLLGKAAPGTLAIDARGRMLVGEGPPGAERAMGPVHWLPPPAQASVR